MEKMRKLLNDFCNKKEIEFKKSIEISENDDAEMFFYKTYKNKNWFELKIKYDEIFGYFIGDVEVKESNKIKILDNYAEVYNEVLIGEYNHNISINNKILLKDLYKEIENVNILRR